jgi:hypothetical protein
MKGDFSIILKKPQVALSSLFNLRQRLYERAVLRETFIQQAYFWLNSRMRPNTTLFDFGAGFGETAIYFAQNSKVKEVIAYEPESYRFSEALKNIRSSPFSRKVVLLNTRANLDLVRSKKAAIKCDIEGAEQELFLNADLRTVYAVQVETHNTTRVVQKYLRTLGFRIPHAVSQKGTLYAEVGMICAERTE